AWVSDGKTLLKKRPAHRRYPAESWNGLMAIFRSGEARSPGRRGVKRPAIGAVYCDRRKRGCRSWVSFRSEAQRQARPIFSKHRTRGAENSRRCQPDGAKKKRCWHI